MSRGCSHEQVSHFMDWSLWRFIVVVMDNSPPPTLAVWSIQLPSAWLSEQTWLPPHGQALLGMLWRWVGLGEQWTQHLSPANDGSRPTSPQSIWVSGLLRLNTKKVRPWSFCKTVGLGVLVWAPPTHPESMFTYPANPKEPQLWEERVPWDIHPKPFSPDASIGSYTY